MFPSTLCGPLSLCAFSGTVRDLLRPTSNGNRICSREAQRAWVVAYPLPGIFAPDSSNLPLATVVKFYEPLCLALGHYYGLTPTSIVF